jgi:choline dehydrogenase-like flavoprotein
MAKGGALTNCQHGEVFDAVVIGTGFAGAVTAARLVQAGQRICVLERGRKFTPSDFPMYPKSESLQRIDGGLADAKEAPDLARWFWPIDQGLYDIRDLDDVVAVQAAGYGGGSLIYANVHLRAPPEVFEQGWPKVYRRKQLDRFYDLAAYMLDVHPMPKRVAKTEQLKRAADELGRKGDWFRPPLAVRFEPKGKNNWGREQGQCDMRGQCWLGCRAQAKNTLDLNYLAIVEDAKGGDGRRLADIRTLAEACEIERTECACGARFVVHWRDRLVHETSGVQPGRNSRDVCCARNVFLCAGAVNSTELLLRSKDLLETRIRERVGSRYHPNADSIATVFDCEQPQEADLGPTITSAMVYDGVRSGSHEHWVLDFVTCNAGDANVALGLERDAVIRCGKAKLRLVQVPLFDFVTATGADRPGVLIVVGDGSTCLAGELLSVGETGAQAFGRMVADARPLEDWFLVEDGGYPTDIEPLLGIMRSPLWLRRNRYIEDPDEEPARQPAQPDIERTVRHTMRAVQQAETAAGRPRFPLSTAIAAFRGMAKRSANVPANVTADLPTSARETEPTFGGMLDELEPFKNAIDRLLPPWLLNALARDRTDLAKALAPVIDLLIDKLLDRLAMELDKRVNIESLASTFGESLVAEIGPLKKETKHILIRGLLRQGIQVLWGNEVALAERVKDLLLQELPKDPGGWANLAAQLLGWLLQYRMGNGRTAVLLIMGRDQFRGRLHLEGTSERLVASLPPPLAASARLAQEGLLRDIAKIWHGELRTNPAWTFFKRRITVHSQGGCPMSSNQSSRVTKYTGEVVGCPGLYVMDAAAFPTAVGVNPSATIVAVAEYKIARFIRKELRIQKFERKPLDADVASWLRRHGDRLDPLAARTTERSAKPASAPLGLTFSEVMSGFGDATQNNDPPVNWDTLNFGNAEIASFDAAERRGVTGDPITVQLTATIGDLGRFLAIQRQGSPEKIRIEGTLTIDKRDYMVVSDKSFLQFFLSSGAARSGGRPERFFRYRIVFASGGRERVIEAAKVLRDDPRLDIWYDLSTLYFDVFEDDPAHSRPVYRGIMRLAPDYFIERQLRSVTITPENADPSRKSWAYFAFARYYGGEVARIYLRKPDLVKDFLKNVIAADGD